MMIFIRSFGDRCVCVRTMGSVCGFSFFPPSSKKMTRWSFSISSNFWCLTVWVLVWRLCGHRCALPAMLGEAGCTDWGCLGRRTPSWSHGGHPREHPDIGANNLFAAAGSWETKSWGVSHCCGYSIQVSGQLPLISEALSCRGNLEYQCLLTLPLVCSLLKV